MGVVRGILTGLLLVLVAGGMDAWALFGPAQPPTKITPNPTSVVKTGGNPLFSPAQPTTKVKTNPTSVVKTGGNPLFSPAQPTTKVKTNPTSVVNIGDKTWVTIDAAFAHDDNDNHYVYLLSGNSVQVLKDGIGQYVMDRSNLNIPKKMDVTAAFVKDIVGNWTIYYGRNKLLAAKGNRRRVSNYGILGAMSWKAPDAAGRKGNDVYLFKGCDMMIRAYKANWLNARALSPQSTPTRLPCDIDAAWPEAEDMIILKGDEYWRWEEGGSVKGPYLFADTYNLADNWALSPTPTKDMLVMN